MRRDDGKVVIADLRGGRNGTDPPLSLPMNQCTEALNVDWYEGMLGRARPGSVAVSHTGGTAFTSGIASLFRFVPGADETLAELWGIDVGGPIVKRLAAGTSFADVTLSDAISTKPQEVEAAVLNGKLYLAYDSAQDRLHTYDPSLSSPRVRRVSITPGTNAPTMANDAAGGAWAATIRYYRVRWWQIDSSNGVQRKSEATPSASFTPSGINTKTVVTQPTPPGEQETHWSIEASSDNATWVGSGVALIATTTIDDNFALTNAAAWPNPSEPSGYFALWPSVKHLLTDGNRLLGAGAWESAGTTSGGKNSRVWFSPVLGSADKGDVERVPNQTNQKNWVDLNENDGGGVTALMGPLNGMPLAAKYRALYLLRPTGDSLAPYQPRKISDWVGCVAGKAWCNGYDEVGAPAIYFYSTHGPYRYSERGGLQYLGRDCEDIWTTVNLSGTDAVAWCLYAADLHQVWFHVATDGANQASTRMVFDVLLGKPTEKGDVRGGWAKHTGVASICGCMFANTLGATMSLDLKPYTGTRTSNKFLLKYNTSDKDDAGTAYQSLLTTRPILPDGALGYNYKVEEANLLGKVNATDTITVTAVRDFGAESRAGTTGLAAVGSETRTQRRVENTDFEGGGVFQYTIGDGSSVASNWVLDALMVPMKRQEVR